MSDLTIFIITTGEESFSECLDSIERQRLSDGLMPAIELIKDVYPVSRAFNQMHERCKTPYFVHVDADVILNDNAIDTLYRAIKKSNPFVYASYGQLYEEGFGPGGSVRCWKKGIFRIFKFRDVRATDRDFYRRAMLLGFHRKDVKRVLGIHRPRQSNFSDYWKTKGDVEKWQFLKRPYERYADSLFQNLIKDPHKNRYKILGFSLGVLSSKDRIYRSKDVYVEQNRLKDLCTLLNIDFDRFNLKENIDLTSLLHIFKDAYLDYSSGAKKRFTSEVAKELFGIEPNAVISDRLYKVISF